MRREMREWEIRVSEQWQQHDGSEISQDVVRAKCYIAEFKKKLPDRPLLDEDLAVLVTMVIRREREQWEHYMNLVETSKFEELKDDGNDSDRED